MPEAEQAIMRDARDAYGRIDRGEHTIDWLAIGRAYNALQARALAASGSNQAVGARYNACWAYYADRYGIAGFDIAKPTKSHCMWLAENWEAVSAWLAQRGANERQQWNHPTTIRRNYLARTVVQPATASQPAKPTPSQAALIEKADAIMALRSGSLLPPGMSMETLGDLLRDRPDKRRSLIRKLQTDIESDERQDRVEAEVARKRGRRS
jgi:hypothetical protein